MSVVPAAAAEPVDDDPQRQRRPPLLNLNLFGIALPSDTIQAIHHFICDYVNRSDVEFEGKLGLIIRNSSNERLYLGVSGTTPLRSGNFDAGSLVPVNFVSNIQKIQFRRINERLNQWFQKCHAQENLTYIRTTELDHFYPDKVRVSIDEKTHQPTRYIKKTRLSSLDIHVPSSQYDIRLSASQETPCHPPTSACCMIRQKNRISYRWSIWSLDVTEIHTYKNVNEGKPIGSSTITHELELEIANVQLVVQLVASRAHPQLLEICKAWLNNLYICGRITDPSFQMPDFTRQQQPQQQTTATAASATPAKRQRSQ